MMMDNSLTGIILYKEGEEKLKRTVSSLPFCQEIIVVCDSVPEKCAKLQQKISSISKKTKLAVISRLLNNDFSLQRNFALEKAAGDWVLYIDSDETVSAALAQEIKAAINSDKADGYYLRRQDYFLGTCLKHGETANCKFIRLAKKGSGKWQGKVHEIWRIRGKLGVLNEPICHFPHDNVSGFLNKINNYTDIVAQYWIEEGRVVNKYQILIYPIGKFLNNYLVKLGILDGIPGLIMAMMMSFHSFLVRSKYFQLMKKP